MSLWSTGHPSAQVSWSFFERFSMRKFVTFSFLAAALGIASSATADAPVVNISTLGGTIFSATYPFVQPISFTVTHTEVKNLNVLDVKVNDVSIFSGGTAIGNPFSGPGNTNECGPQMILPNISTCNVSDPANASATARWTVSAPGTYTVAVSLKHRNDIGEDEEEVLVQTLSIEHPAPPAVANAFINSSSSLKAAYGKKRSCIINEIAKLHGQQESYGPKPGPYNAALIQQDVVAFGTTCP
jgi:hypothetical protein